MTTTRARWTLMLSVTGLIAAAALLPGPGRILSDISDPRPAAVLGAIITGIAAAITWALAAWAGLAVAAGILACVSSGSGHTAAAVLHRIAPRAIRQMIGLALGVTLAVSVVAPSYAADSAGPPISDSASADLPIIALDLDWMPAGDGVPDQHSAPDDPKGPLPVPPQLPTGDAEAAARTSSHPANQPAPNMVTVLPGDCLWSIAAAHLPAGASARQIDAAWHNWYRMNRTVIGADPNLLIPGQELAVPPPRDAVAATPLPGGAL